MLKPILKLFHMKQFQKFFKLPLKIKAIKGFKKA